MSGGKTAVMVLWAGRDVLRRPGSALLLALCSALLTTVATVPLVLTEALADTARALLRAGPSLVVRRLDSAGVGAVPLPSAEAARRARSVLGVIEARPRIWGVARADDRPVTVVGVDEGLADEAQVAAFDEGRPALSDAVAELVTELGSLGPGQVIVGPGLASGIVPGKDRVTLRAAAELRVEVVRALDESYGMALHDVVLLRSDDARALLAIPAGHASDLAIRVFHEQEAEAVVGDLVSALPWPVQVVRRSEVVGMYDAGLGRRGGLFMLALLPAVLGLLLLCVAVWRDGRGEWRELALLDALGWTASDVAKLHVARVMCIALPAVLIGLCAGYAAVMWPGARWIGELVLGWSGDAVALALRPTSGALIAAEVGAFVLLPLLLVSAVSVVRAARVDADHWLRQG